MTFVEIYTLGIMAMKRLTLDKPASSVFLESMRTWHDTRPSEHGHRK